MLIRDISFGGTTRRISAVCTKTRNPADSRSEAPYEKVLRFYKAWRSVEYAAAARPLVIECGKRGFIPSTSARGLARWIGSRRATVNESPVTASTKQSEHC